MTRLTPAVADPTAQAAPPRSNGELVFEAPWESRAFGVAVALHDAGVVDFEDFRAAADRGDRRVGDRARPSAGGYRYYERWLTALERTLLDRGLVDVGRASPPCAMRSSTSGRTTTATSTDAAASRAASPGYSDNVYVMPWRAVLRPKHRSLAGFDAVRGVDDRRVPVAQVARARPFERTVGIRASEADPRMNAAVTTIFVIAIVLAGTIAIRAFGRSR